MSAIVDNPELRDELMAAYESSLSRKAAADSYEPQDGDTIPREVSEAYAADERASAYYDGLLAAVSCLVSDLVGDRVDQLRASVEAEYQRLILFRVGNLKPAWTVRS